MRHLVSRSRRFSPKSPSPSLVSISYSKVPNSAYSPPVSVSRADDGIILIGRDSQRFPTPLSSHESNTVFLFQPVDPLKSGPSLRSTSRAASHGTLHFNLVDLTFHLAVESGPSSLAPSGRSPAHPEGCCHRRSSRARMGSASVAIP